MSTIASGHHGRRNKYGNRRTTVDGITFDSAKEAARWGTLKLMERAGKISGLRVHPRYRLNVKGEGIGFYEADFEYWDARAPQIDGNGAVLERFVYRGDQTLTLVVEDVKGGRATQTPHWRWKVKHFKAEYGITVRVVE